MHSFEDPDYSDLGTLGKLMPSFRAKLIREFQAEKQRGEWQEIEESVFVSYLGPLEKDLLLLHELMLPVGTKNQPLEDTAEFQAIKKASRDTSIARVELPFEMVGLVPKQNSEELFQSLSEPIKTFFETFPACKALDKRMRVTEGVIAWRHHMDEVAKKTPPPRHARVLPDEGGAPKNPGHEGRHRRPRHLRVVQKALCSACPDRGSLRGSREGRENGEGREKGEGRGFRHDRGLSDLEASEGRPRALQLSLKGSSSLPRPFHSES